MVTRHAGKNVDRTLQNIPVLERSCFMEDYASMEDYALLLTPQKNGRGPGTTPLTFLPQAWCLRKDPNGA